MARPEPSRARRASRRAIDARDANGDASSAIVAIVSRAPIVSRDVGSLALDAPTSGSGSAPRASRGTITHRHGVVVRASRARDPRRGRWKRSRRASRRGRRTHPWFTSRALERRSARRPRAGRWVGPTACPIACRFSISWSSNLSNTKSTHLERCLLVQKPPPIRDSRVYHDHLDLGSFERARRDSSSSWARDARAAAPRRRRERRPRTFRRNGPARSRAGFATSRPRARMRPEAPRAAAARTRGARRARTRRERCSRDSRARCARSPMVEPTAPIDAREGWIRWTNSSSMGWTRSRCGRR